MIQAVWELTTENAAAYLADVHGYAADCLQVTWLGGGVSNSVLLIETPEDRFVLKQSLGKLRVEQEWLSDRRRIWRECDAMRKLAPVMPHGSVPGILFEDRERFLFAMEAAPAGAAPWKSLLMQGTISQEIARQTGAMLGTMIAATWQSPEWEHAFGDQTVFDELRLDPYYRTVARRHPDLAHSFERLLALTASRRLSLTHGDWSPKNLLVSGDRVTAIDFEVIHYGDPAFDAGFLLNHLALKSFRNPQWSAQYRAAAQCFWATLLEALPDRLSEFETAAIAHLGGLMLARIDGKSPAEYITEPALQEKVRQFARHLILEPPGEVMDVFRSLP